VKLTIEEFQHSDPGSAFDILRSLPNLLGTNSILPQVSCLDYKYAVGVAKGFPSHFPIWKVATIIVSTAVVFASLQVALVFGLRV
jgi:hypothetical protein